MWRLLTLSVLLATATAQARTASPIHVRHTHIDNLSYELDCLAGLVRCTRTALPLAGAFDASDIERWRQTAAAAARIVETTALALPTASDLRGVSSRHFGGIGPGRAIPTPERRNLIDKLLRRTSVRWERKLAPQLARQRVGLETAAARIELDILLPQLAALYGQRSDTLPAISLIAIEGTRNGSLATLDGHVAFVETPIADAADSRLPVIVHEFVHHWQQRMPEAQRREVVNAFLEAPGDCAVTAYHFFDEAMASVIGNGLIESRLLGEAAFAAYEALPDSYYADYRIDRIAKALRPRLQRQLQTQGVIDARFITDYVAIARDALGADCSRLDSTLHTVSFVMTSPDMDEAQRLAQDRLAPATAFVDVVTTDGMRTAASRHAALPVVAIATADTLDWLDDVVPEAVVARLRRRVADQGRLVYGMRRETGGSMYLVVGEDVEAAAVTLLQLVVLQRDAFEGVWQPPPLPDSVPD